jgi:dihydrodipicolinate synthase/N-acetylneuraminate lyase
MSVAWQGVFSAATTQFQPDQSLDVPATIVHVGKMIDAGIHGLIMLGTVGENCSLLYEEKLEVLRATVKHVAGRVPVLMFVALADQANLVAIKESSENVRRITDLRNVCGERYILFCGVDDLVLESLLLGATGWVSGLVNAFPAENRLLWDLATTGRWDEAREVYRWYTPLLHLDTHVKLVQYIKLAQQECGLGSETVRAPRLSLVGEERERVLAIIRRGIASRPRWRMPCSSS